MPGPRFGAGVLFFVFPARRIEWARPKGFSGHLFFQKSRGEGEFIEILEFMFDNSIAEDNDRPLE
jgi:hypothetical protein